MSMYAAYYDASGQQKDLSRPLVVAGLLSTERRWRRFEREWGAVLGAKEFDVPYLHMKEFAHSSGPFAKWKGGKHQDTRDKFLTRLLGVLKGCVNRFELTRIEPRDFESLNRSYKLKECLGGPYPLAASICLTTVREWMRVKRSGNPIEHYFEAGDDGQKLFKVLLGSAGIQPHIKYAQDPDTGEWFKPFQGADFVAYEFATEILRQGEGGARTRRTRPWLLAMLKHLPHTLRELDVTGLQSAFNERPDLFPRRGDCGESP